MENTYSIPTFKMDEFNKKIAKMSNKSVRFGLPQFKVEVLGTEIIEHEVKTTNGHGQYNKVTELVKIEYTQVRVEGEAPTLQGYKIIAMLEQFEGKNIVKRFDNETESRITTESLACRSTYCEHCNSSRYRKFIFVLEDENGHLVQVGKSCLKDFTNCNLSAESIANYFGGLDALHELGKLDEDSEGFYSSYSGYILHDLKTIVSLSIYMTDTKGYKSSQANVSTRQDVFNYLYSRNILDEYKKMPELTDIEKENEAMANEVIEYYKNIEAKNDYLYNLKTLLSSQYANGKYFGYIVSAYSSYLRAKETDTERELREKAQKLREQARADREQAEVSSQFVGEIGQRETFNLQFTHSFSYETMFGTGFMYFFLDEIENVFMWSTNKFLRLEAGEQVKIVGTIKEHKTYKDVNQTVLTRCKI